MSQTIVEHIRETAVNKLFQLNTFNNSWNTWRNIIQQRINPISPINIINLGDQLADVFFSTRAGGRSQSSLSGGGATWEALVCWYMNLCLAGSRTVVFKQHTQILPTPIKEALTVSYGSFPSNTESDLIALTFPDNVEYTTQDKFEISATDINGNNIPTRNNNNTFNYKPIIDFLVARDFTDIEIGVIQCKTNWNDNAQIPMLWDMIYASQGFTRNLITVGTTSYSIRNCRRFTYSFVTVPTSNGNFTPTSTCVLRVHNLSGGNYWGLPSRPAVASSLKEIFNRNFQSGSPSGITTQLNSIIQGQNIINDYAYFNI